MKLPIVVGVTGHRDLRPQDIPKLRNSVRAALEKLKRSFSHSDFVLLDSLASGADALCAEEALRTGFSLVCPLPMEAGEYRRDFSGGDLFVFDALIGKAEAVFVAPHVEPEADDRSYLYRQAGIYVAAHSHVLLALWDGSPAKPDGCGTAETVDFMLRGGYREEGPFCGMNGAGAVIHISTPRQRARTDFPITAKLIEAKPGCLDAILRSIDDRNRENGS